VATKPPVHESTETDAEQPAPPGADADADGDGEFEVVPNWAKNLQIAALVQVVTPLSL
jgi:hypothetical protein